MRAKALFDQWEERRRLREWGPSIRDNDGDDGDDDDVRSSAHKIHTLVYFHIGSVTARLVAN
jgi:hypothetical protein